MITSQNISIQLEGIGDLISNKKFRVPAYQRAYAWEEDHVTSLLNDLKDAIANKEREYFLGSVVVTSGDTNRFEVVDGQQRLTTISLIINAIKTVFALDGDHQMVDSLQADFLTSLDRKTRENEPKLILNEIDNELFQNIIQKDSEHHNIFLRRDFKSKTPSNLKLINAYQQCFQFFNEESKLQRDSEEYLQNWLDYIQHSAKVILVISPDDSNAFVIFETLNDRGLDLAISDLLKNYLFHKSAERLEETKNRWAKMTALLESTSDDPLVVTYLRHYAMSQYGLIREKELFSVLKRKITSKRLAVDFSEKLDKNAVTYSALINANHEYWKNYNNLELEKSIKVFNLLGMVQIRPLLLSIINTFNHIEINKAFKVLVSVAIRYQIVGGIGGGYLENLYAQTAQQISSKKIETAKQILEEFKNLPTDETFKEAFSIANISKAKIARYYLSEIENSENSEIIPNPDTKVINLEHILPQTYDSSSVWADLFNEDEHKSYSRRLGNMCLLSSDINSELDNLAPYDEKLQFYKKASFIHTNQLGIYESWTKDNILKRQIIMAEKAVKIWSLNV
ncbi:DUF262 domain-containing protein [Acinetobacter indicus]|uniref:DUF262 domain-containing protein n=1 Tax=Acinetobacter indicus TaxID=756892 RepID=UPI0025774DA7|nr:DUF262 domain-containing HNH endonuclease family protein [Acinetobacter indicus]MDM1303241.1 DUF262 domain-containing protein [Acinetobacter indicus]